MPFFNTPPTTQTAGVGGSTSSQQNPLNPPQPQSQSTQPVQTPSVSTPQRARVTSVSAMMTTPESVLNSGLANGDISRESMDTDLETPLPSAPYGVGTTSSLVNSPTTATPAPAPAQTSNRRPGKKKKKRGRKPKDRSQVDNSAAATNSTQGASAVESGGVYVQQPNAVDQNSRAPVGGAVVGGVSGHHAHTGDDALRTSREQMEVENRRRSIGSSSSISVPPLPSHNPHHLNNSYASGASGSGNQAQQASETGQSRLMDHHRTPSAPSGVTTPSRESAGTMSSLPLGPGGVVRIKQEPITNHEEEMETNQPTAHQHQRQPTTKVRIDILIHLYCHVKSSIVLPVNSCMYIMHVHV